MAKDVSTQITKIGHGGDFHSFQNKRHTEFDELTDRLCDLIVKEGIQLFYFGGDIVDSKTKLSPEQVKSIKHLVKQVSDLVPTVWILGNHDLNLKNKERLDALTPFLEDFEAKCPIHFLTRSGIYNLHGINWAVWSCLDDQKNPFDNFDMKTLKSGPIIGCFHGIVDGALADNDFYKLSANTSIDEFKKCDVVFLNDIHKRQSFRNNEIQYSGSWCQTKVSEDESKGVLVWNWSEKKDNFIAEFKELHHTFGYRTYEIQDLTTFQLPEDDLPRSYVPRLLYTGDVNAYSPTLFEGLKKQLQTKVDAEVVLQVKPYNTKKTITTKQKGKIVDFFKQYFTDLEYKDEQIEALKEIDEHYNKLVDLSDYESGQYEVEEITVHNFLSYGPNNVVKLSEMPGIIGLFAPNRTGKSTLLDAIMFCHYNRTSRVAKPTIGLINDQINKEAYVETKTIVNGSKWRVKRTLTPKKDSVTTTLEVYETVNGKEIPRHKESRKDTEPMLRKMFGDAEIFLLTALCTQKKPVEFVDCQNADRLDLFLRFLGITTYEQKHELAKVDLSSKQLDLDGLRRELQSFEGEEIVKEKISIIKGKITDENLIVKKQDKEIKLNNKEIDTLRELIDALQLVELSKTIEELSENKTAEVETISSKKDTLKSQQSELIVLNKDWKENCPDATPNDWIDDVTKETPLIAKIEELRDKLIPLQLKTSARSIEGWEEQKEVILENVKQKKLDKLALEEIVAAALIEDENIKEWEADPLEDIGPNKKTNNAEVQIEQLETELESEMCPTCNQKRVEFNKEEIQKRIEDCKEIVKKNKELVAVNRAERSRLSNIQKQYISATAALKLQESELLRVASDLVKIEEEIAALKENDNIEKKRKVILVELEEVKKELEIVKVEKSVIVELQKKITTIFYSNELLITQIDLANNKIKEIDRDIKTLTINKANKEKRELLKVQIDALNEINGELLLVKQSAEVAVISFEKDVKAQSDSLTIFSNKHKTLLEKERELNYHQAYAKSLHRSGIPFLILQTYIPDINFEINDNLQGLFDFSVFFELDEKSLDIYYTDNSIKQNKRDVSNTSGVEGFVINLAIRAALTRISLLPKPSIFMIDEGFSVSDTDNLELLKELLSKFKSQYNNIVMITHLDDLKDYPEHYITLEKKNGVTSILP